MATLFRYQNPTVNSTIQLGFDVYNSNNYSDPAAFIEVDIYFLDPTARRPDNPHGKVLFATIPGDQVVRDDVGQYHVDRRRCTAVVVGNYIDVWQVQFTADEPPGEVEQTFAIYPDLWITSPIPIVYDFQFKFTPTRWRKGEIKYLKVEITPLVPRQSDLVRYYTNLAIASSIGISIEQHCGECNPPHVRKIYGSSWITFLSTTRKKPLASTSSIPPR